MHITAKLDKTDKAIKHLWSDFANGKIKDHAVLRQEVLESWERCQNSGIPRCGPIVAPLLSPTELKKLRQQKSELREIGLPVMQSIYDVVKDTGFGVYLTDENGVILDVLADPSLAEESQENHFISGGVWTESCVGTNAIGTSIVLRNPFQLNYAEHHCEKFHRWSCSASPILDQNHQIVGVLNLTGFLEKSNPHTLGIAIFGANTIEREIKLRQALNVSEQAHQSLLTTIELLPSGVFVVNSERTITQINNKACELLRASKEDIIDHKYNHIIGEMDCIENTLRYGQKMEDREKHIDNRGRDIQLMVSSLPIFSKTGQVNEVMVILREIETMMRIARKIVGLSAYFTFDDIIGQSTSFREVLEQAKLAAKTSATILLLGESGTGKEMIAQAIHNTSPRKNEPFVVINCGALPRELIGSELFGYTEGAFTGAKRGGNSGKFELANGGTLFLDEIGDMPMDLQLSLLRVLQDHTVTRLGSHKAIHVNVRLIAATNKDLEQLVDEGLFRQDLYYRINVISLKIPPLRERSADIIHLANHFIQAKAKKLQLEIDGLSSDDLQLLAQYHWPGNVRELENFIERALIFNENSNFKIPAWIQPTKETSQPQPAIDDITLSRSLQSEEKRLIINALIECQGNISKAASCLGITRATLYRRMNQYDIKKAIKIVASSGN